MTEPTSNGRTTADVSRLSSADDVVLGDADTSRPRHQGGGHSEAPVRQAPGLLDVKGAAQRLGTPERFIRRLVEQRRITFYRVGKYVRFDPRDIDRWLSKNRVDPRENRSRGG